MEQLRLDTCLLSVGPAVAMMLIHQHNGNWPAADLISSRISKYGFSFCDKDASSWLRLVSCLVIHESDQHLFDNACDITAAFILQFVTERRLDVKHLIRDTFVGAVCGALSGLVSYHLHWRCFGATRLDTSEVSAGFVGAFTRPFSALWSRLATKAVPLNSYYCGAEPLISVIRGFHLALRPQLALVVPIVGRVLLDFSQLAWISDGGEESGTHVRDWRKDLFAPTVGFAVGYSFGLVWKAVQRRLEQVPNRAGLRRGNALAVPRPIVLPPALQVVDPQCPPEFLCPLSRCVMVDPVVMADGQTYERAAIEQWLSLGHSTSPITNTELPYLDLVPNFALRQIMTDWR